MSKDTSIFQENDTNATGRVLPPGVVIAGTQSGCGKTLVALGLAAVLVESGLRVQGYKVGPDFIDPTHLAAICRRPVHNLDGWMLSRDVVLEIFQRHSRDADFCLVEGVMGLFDGASGADESGSTAQMAKWLGLPVILVVNARSQGRSAAALVRGFRDFDPELDLAGVVFTQVGGPGHVAMLREAMTAWLPELPCLGFLPRQSDLALPARHLGLHMADDLAWDAQRRATLTTWIAHGLDMDVLHRITLGADKAHPLSLPHVPPYPHFHSEPLPEGKPVAKPVANSGAACREAIRPGLCLEVRPGVRPRVRPRVRLGVARDSAFCFYYQENLRLLEQAGAELVFFSPLTESALPRDLQGLYLGGGYPELHAAGLAENTSMRRAVAAAAEAGMPVYAECGGLLYLLDELEDVDGRTFPMAGFFRGRAKMLPRFQALGYRKAVLRCDTLLGPAQTVLRGHEFHYSALCSDQPTGATLAYRVTDRRGCERLEGFQRKNVLASYIHLHFGSHPQAALFLVRACQTWAAHCDQRT